MIVEDTESLQTWLATFLKPLCDAEPAALARYVLALVRKDNSEKELRQSMVDQLDVFLQSETESFVDKLFETLNTKEYLNAKSTPTPPSETFQLSKSESVSGSGDAKASISDDSNSESSPTKTNKLAVSSLAATAETEPISSTSGPNNVCVNANLAVSTTSSSGHADSKEGGKTSSSANSSSRQRDRRDDDRDKNRRKRSRTARDRRGSRSHSADRVPLTSKRSRSSPRLDRARDRDRDRNNDRPLRHRPGRKSPPPRKYDRNSWDRIIGITRGGDQSISPSSRSRSPHAAQDSSKKDSLLPIPPGPDADLSTKEIADKTPLVQSVVVRPGGKQGGSHSADDPLQRSGATSNSGNNRCKDFDEKGLCMHGELCPFDHGKYVLEYIVVPGVGSGAPSGYGAAGRGMARGTPGYNHPLVRPAIVGEYYPDSPSLEPPVRWGPGAPPHGFRPRHMGFDALAARGGRGGLLLRPSAVGSYPGGQRQLISVPVVGGVPPGPHGMPSMALHPGIRGVWMHRGHRGGGRGGFDHSRLDAKPLHHNHHHQHRNYNNCSLEVRKIPREQNTIMNLNSHFQRFGKIINIQINFDSDPEAALVTFSCPSEAQLAHRLTDAVFNNRFIRVFWHNKEKENEEEAEAAAVAASGNALNPGRIPVKERLGAHTQDRIPMDHEKILMSGKTLTKTVYNNSALFNKKMETPQDKLETVESIKRNQEMLAAHVTLKNLHEQKKAEALKMSNDLRKRQQSMMEEQIVQQKKLISKLESGSLSAKEKEETLKVLKVLQDSAAKLKEDLDDRTLTAKHSTQQSYYQVIVKNPVVVEQGLFVGPSFGTPRTKREAQKEMLDAELDLINEEQQGRVDDLQKKVLELRARAKSLGLNGQGIRGRGGFRGNARGFGRPRGILRGCGSVRALRSVDRRPTKIRITGFPATKLSEILDHFSVFGAIREYSSDANVPMMIVDFDSRKCAEVAMANGHMFEDIKLSLEWVTKTASDRAGGKSRVGSLEASNIVDSSNHHDDLDTNETIEEDDMGIGEDEELGLDSGEICLTGEDEEEDEDDRSWRR